MATNFFNGNAISLKSWDTRASTLIRIVKIISKYLMWLINQRFNIASIGPSKFDVLEKSRFVGNKSFNDILIERVRSYEVKTFIGNLICTNLPWECLCEMSLEIPFTCEVRDLDIPESSSICKNDHEDQSIFRWTSFISSKLTRDPRTMRALLEEEPTEEKGDELNRERLIRWEGVEVFSGKKREVIILSANELAKVGGSKWDGLVMNLAFSIMKPKKIR